MSPVAPEEILTDLTLHACKSTPGKGSAHEEIVVGSQRVVTELTLGCTPDKVAKSIPTKLLVVGNDETRNHFVEAIANVCALLLLGLDKPQEPQALHCREAHRDG